MSKKTIYKRFRDKVFDAFDFSKSEQRGIIVLFIVLLLLIVFRIVFSYIQTAKIPTDNTQETVLLFMQQQQKYEDSISSIRNQKSKYANNIYDRRENLNRRQLTPFSFDPNGMNFSDWKRMGFTDKEAQQIVNFQSKGGRFFQKSDLKKLYCISDDDYQLLEPYIDIHSVQTSKPETVKVKNYQHAQLDINTVDSIELQKIPGIGQKTASRIIQYREKLGGFVHLHQLKEVYAVDSNRFLQIEPYLYVDKTKIKKMNINKAEIKELVRHPYIEYYIAKSIVVHRQNYGKYDSVEDIKKAVHFYDELYLKIIPYLEVE